jgi:four helix bundle protein
VYNFEKLKAWQEAVKLVEIIYVEIKKFPPEEKFGLVDQLRRASTSVSLNIAEGSGCNSKKAFVSYLEIALRSLYETVSILKIAERLFQKNFSAPLEQCDLVAKILHGLIRSLNLTTKN